MTQDDTVDAEEERSEGRNRPSSRLVAHGAPPEQRTGGRSAGAPRTAGPPSGVWGDDTEHTPMVTPSDVIEHVYCPRYTWFLRVQNIPQFEQRRFKVLKGREVHRRREEHNRRYFRKKIGVVDREISVYLASRKLRVRGVVDEVLRLTDGTMAPLDYKYTRSPEKAFRTHRLQVTLYGMLIAEAYGAPVNRGYVAYVRGGNELREVTIDERAMIEASGIVDEIFDIILTGCLPPRTRYRVRCADCCYRNICV